MEALVNARSGWTNWSIRHGNTGATNQDIKNYVLEDTFPLGTMLDHIESEAWPLTSNPVTISYKTNKNASYRNWITGARYNTGSATQYIYPIELTLTTAEYVTALRWSYGTLLGGGKFHPDAMSRPLRFTTRIVDPSAPAFAAGQSVLNCATFTSGNESPKNSCGSVTASQHPVG